MPLKCIACPRPATELHHVLRKQDLRRAARSRRNPDAAPFSVLAADQRNLIPLCDPCHDRHHSVQAPLPASVLPIAAVAFVHTVLGDGPARNYLERRYA